MPYVVVFRVGAETCRDSFESYAEVLEFVEFLHSEIMCDEDVSGIRAEVVEAA